ncbi:MAG: WD40 repeat domain-containing protein, partial [Planctomycetales bacterium]|nr:WD40 repeat domain-containing protein [Planctomycetales bacterium]
GSGGTGGGSDDPPDGGDVRSVAPRPPIPPPDEETPVVEPMPPDEPVVDPTPTVVLDPVEQANRDVVRWLLTRGGSLDVEVDGQPLALAAAGDVAKLPSDGALRVVRAALAPGDAPTADEIKSLAGLAELRWLDMTAVNVDDSTLDALLGAASLKHLGLRGTTASAAAIARLRKSLPDCELAVDDQPITPPAAVVPTPGDPVLTAHTRHNITAHGGEIRAAVFSPDGKQFATASYDESIRLWDTATGDRLATLAGHRDWVLGLAYSPDGKTLVSVSRDKSIRTWDVEGKRFKATLSDKANTPTCVAFAADGRSLATAGLDGALTMWVMPAGTLRGALRGHADAIYALDFSPDSQMLASGSKDKTVRVINGQTGKLMHVLSEHKDTVLAVKFSPDNALLATGGADNEIILWDPATGEVKRRLHGHTYAVHGLSFSADGKLLASAGYDGGVRLWDVASGTLVCSLGGHSDSVTGVAFSPVKTEGQPLPLLSCSVDESARLWMVDQVKVQSWPAGDWIDLLAAYDPQRDAVQGVWELQSGELKSPCDRWVRAALPAIPEGSYRLSLQFTRDFGEGGVSFALPVGNRQLLCTLGGYPESGYVAGLGQIDGKNAFENATMRRLRLKTGQAYWVDADVQLDAEGKTVAVQVSLDGEKIIDWGGPVDKLADSWWNAGDDVRKFAVATEQSVVRFHAIHLQMKTGSAAMLGAARPPVDAAREAAQWALAKGGSCLIASGGRIARVKAGQPLPEEKFALVGINVDGKGVSDGDLWRLRSVGQLAYLGLDGATLSERGAGLLQSLPRLSRLDLADGSVSPAALEALGKISSLRQIDLRGAKASAADVEKLQATADALRILP